MVSGAWNEEALSRLVDQSRCVFDLIIMLQKRSKPQEGNLTIIRGCNALLICWFTTFHCINWIRLELIRRRIPPPFLSPLPSLHYSCPSYHEALWLSAFKTTMFDSHIFIQYWCCKFVKPYEKQSFDNKLAK